ncbi:MAG: Uma2 family endonuclease [Acidimicrobiales bacterium]
MTAIEVQRELPDLIRPLRRSEYDQLVELGVFDDEPIELLGGVLVRMSPEGTPHSWIIQELNRLLVRGLPDHLRLRVGHPFAASAWSEPEPDLAVVPVDDYRRDHPALAVLLIEVSHSSLHKDLGVKADLYARAGVPEYWVIDVARGVVHRHVQPSPEGYAEVAIYGEEALLDACGVTVVVSDLFAE